MLLNFVSFGQSPLFSKDFKIKTGTPYKVIDADRKYYFEENEILIAIKFEKRKMFIQKIDLKSMREISSREVTDLPEDYIYEDLVQVKNKVLFMYSLYDKPRETEQLFVRPISFEKGHFAEAGKLLLDVESKVTGSAVRTGYYRMETRDKFRISTSLDSSLLMIRYSKKPVETDNSKSFEVYGLNVYKYENDFEKIWSQEVKMPYTEYRMDILQFMVDSKANAYALVQVYEGDNRRVKDKDGFVLYSMELFKIDAQTRTLTISKVSVDQKFIRDIEMLETNDHGLALAGYYSNGNKKEYGVDGAFASMLNAKGEVISTSSYEIPLEIITQNSSKKEVKKATKKENENGSVGAQLKDLYLDDVFVNTDGSIILAGEQFRTITTTRTSPNGGTETSTSYNYEDIVVMKINPDGKLGWIKRLPKFQKNRISTLGDMSYKFIIHDKSYYILFMDAIQNYKLSDTEEPRHHVSGSRGHLTAYKIDDSTGQTSKHLIFDSEDVNGIEIFQFKPTRLFKGLANDFYLEVYKKGNQDLIIKLSLQENQSQK